MSPQARFESESLRERLVRGAARPSVRLGLPRTAGVAVILRGTRMLWIRRAENPADPWSGHMGFPGGQEEPGDPDSRRTAERETREELGLDLGGAEYLGALDEVQARNRAGIQPIQIAPHLFWLTAEPALSVNSAEVDEVHWIPVAHFFDAANRTTLELGSRALPAFRFGERIIWGLSYRILTDLLSRLE